MSKNSLVNIVTIRVIYVIHLFFFKLLHTMNITKNDIVSNPYSLDIKEVNAELIPSLREDGAFAIINGNYAISAGISISSSLALEKSDGVAAKNYANVLAVKEGSENNPKIKALYEALTSSKIKDYIIQTYLGAVIPLF